MRRLFAAFGDRCGVKNNRRRTPRSIPTTAYLRKRGINGPGRHRSADRQFGEKITCETCPTGWCVIGNQLCDSPWGLISNAKSERKK